MNVFRFDVNWFELIWFDWLIELNWFVSMRAIHWFELISCHSIDRLIDLIWVDLIWLKLSWFWDWLIDWLIDRSIDSIRFDSIRFDLIWLCDWLIVGQELITSPCVNPVVDRYSVITIYILILNTNLNIYWGPLPWINTFVARILGSDFESTASFYTEVFKL